MELNKEDLQFLVEKAWSLHGRLNGEIKNSISFCRFCPEHGRNFHIAETPFDERERLIIIRDSLKDVEDNLMFLQVKNVPSHYHHHPYFLYLRLPHLYIFRTRIGYKILQSTFIRLIIFLQAIT